MAAPTLSIAGECQDRSLAGRLESPLEALPAPTLPKWLVLVVLLVCVLPLLLSAIGVQFDLPVDVGAIAAGGSVDGTIRHLSGSYVHTLLEWTATVIAVVTAVLAFTHFLISRDVITPIIGFALLSAGLVDAFHVLAADRLISATASNQDFIPFTWAISRTFNAVIPLTALALLVFSRRFEVGSMPRQSIAVIVAASVLIAAIAYGLIRWCATSENLPQTLFPGAVISRPWDVYPLIIYAASGFLIYPLFGRRINSFFALALWLSVVPDVATQLYMAFGSAALFDHYFNVAHFLKIIAYLVPCIGLLYDYVATYRRADTLQVAVSLRADELARSNADLEKFAYVASHDLRSPLRAIDNLSMFIEEDLGEVMTDLARANMQRLRGRVQRLDRLLDDLLQYSRVGRKASEPVDVDTGKLVRDIVDMLDVAANLKIDVAADMPVLRTERPAIELVLRNLIGNAIKHRDELTTRIEVSGRCDAGTCEFRVSDDGPGIAPEYHERIFEMFQTLQPRDSREGSGMGLAIIKKLIELRGGEIRILDDRSGRGACFEFTWPVSP